MQVLEIKQIQLKNFDSHPIKKCEAFSVPVSDMKNSYVLF